MVLPLQSRVDPRAAGMGETFFEVFLLLLGLWVTEPQVGPDTWLALV